MPDLWAISVALIVDQIAIAIATGVALLMALTSPFARWMHRHRGVVLTIGVLAAVVPLIHFAKLFVTGEGATSLTHLVASLIWLVVQVLLYILEGKRHHSQRSPVK